MKYRNISRTVDVDRNILVISVELTVLTNKMSNI